MSDQRAAPAGDLFMPQLDGLRAIAVGAVMVHHLIDGKYLPSFIGMLHPGFSGVRLFFVLSGFLITGILIRVRDEVEHRKGTPLWALRQFYARRFLRIFPLYYAVIAVLAVVNLPPVREEFWWLASYMYNYRVASLGWFHANIAHFWSLSVEEQFYLFWPWVVLFAPARRLTLIAIGMTALGPISRLLLIIGGASEVAPYVATPTCLDALGCGALLAIFTRGGSATPEMVSRMTRTALPIGLVSVVLLEVFYRAGAWQYTAYAYMIMYDTALAILFAWLVAAASGGFSGAFGRFLTLAPITYSGRIAYGLYVFHLVIAQSLFELGNRIGVQWEYKGPAYFVVASLCTFALASLSWHIFEKPLNDLKRYFPYRPTERREPARAMAT